MAILRALFVAAAAICAVHGDTIKITAQDDNKFNPSSFTAKEGDILEFHFQPHNHSVVSGEYSNACSPMELGKGFFSGFMAVDSGEADKVFRVTVANGDPIVFYSSQGDECSKGMAGIVNPDDKHTLEGYQGRAKQLARAVTPGLHSFGGELAENNEKDKGKSPSGDKNSTKTDNSAGRMLGAPVAGVIAAAAVQLVF